LCIENTELHRIKLLKLLKVCWFEWCYRHDTGGKV